MADFLELTLGAQTFRFGSRRALAQWWAKERSNWSWITEIEPVPRDFRSLINLFNAIDRQMADADAQEIGEQLVEFFQDARPSARHSSTIAGQRYLNAYQQAGASAAVAVMLVEQQPTLFANLIQQRPDLVAAYSRGVAASYSGMGGDKAEFAQERRNYRIATERLEQRVRDLESEKDDFVAERQHRIQKWTRFFIRRIRNDLDSAAAEFEKQRQVVTGDFFARRDEALNSISETEAKYRLQMALQAPVQYWTAKASKHSRWVGIWAAIMIVYFGFAAFGIYLIAEQAADYLVTIPEGQHATPVYIIVSGATLGASTLIFWLGRLITKLFLSEHHLASDAREKAVMMQAFLSMETRETFSSEERSIVLASIFRSSPDGIVKDDGPADLGVQAMLARQLVR